jgi:hypothetical protein
VFQGSLSFTQGRLLNLILREKSRKLFFFSPSCNELAVVLRLWRYINGLGAAAFSQYWARSLPPLLLFWTAKEISDPLDWLSPAVPWPLPPSWAMTPTVRTAKAIATAAATFASMDNFICRLAP